MLKYLRIGVTGLSLMACVLLIALWVRSYWRFDEARAPVAGGRIIFSSAQGKFRFHTYPYSIPPSWVWYSRPVRPNDLWPVLQTPGGRSNYFRTSVFSLYSTPLGGVGGRMHWWVPTLTFLTLSAAPWLTSVRRFSLRALLIAMTLVAVGLGLIAVSS